MIYTSEPCNNSFCSCQYETGKGFICAFPRKKLRWKIFARPTTSGVIIYYYFRSDDIMKHWTLFHCIDQAPHYRLKVWPDGRTFCY